MSQNPIKQVLDWYLLSERRKLTFLKLKENSMLSYDEVIRLKQAKALFQIIPLGFWSPYLLFMLPRSVYANTQQKFKKALAYGIIGAACCEVVSREVRDRCYWPIVAQVYRELVEKEKKRKESLAPTLENLQHMIKPTQQIQEPKYEQQAALVSQDQAAIQKQMTQEEINMIKHTKDSFIVQLKLTYQFLISNK